MLALEIGTGSTRISIKQLSSSKSCLWNQSTTRASRHCSPLLHCLRCGSATHYAALREELRTPFSTLPSTAGPPHVAPSVASLHQQNCSRTCFSPAVPSLTSRKGKRRLEMHVKDRFKADQLSELPPTKNCAGTTEDATAWQFWVICISCCVLTHPSTSHAFSPSPVC